MRCSPITYYDSNANAHANLETARETEISALYSAASDEDGCRLDGLNPFPVLAN